MYLNDLINRIKKNHFIMAIPLLYNLLFYVHLQIEGVEVARFRIPITLPSALPDITQVVNVEFPRLQTLLLEMIELSPGLTYELFMETFPQGYLLSFLTVLVVFSLIGSFLQGGFLGLIKNDFEGKKASISSFSSYGRYFFFRMFLTDLFYFLMALIFIALFLAIIISADFRFILSGGLFITIIIILLALLIIVFLLVFHKYAIVENDTGVFDGMRKSYLTVKANLKESIKYILLVLLIMLVGGTLTQVAARLSLLFSIFIFIPVGTLGVYIIYDLYRNLNTFGQTEIAVVSSEQEGEID